MAKKPVGCVFGVSVAIYYCSMTLALLVVVAARSSSAHARGMGDGAALIGIGQIFVVVLAVVFASAVVLLFHGHFWPLVDGLFLGLGLSVSSVFLFCCAASLLSGGIVLLTGARPDKSNMVNWNKLNARLAVQEAPPGVGLEASQEPTLAQQLRCPFAALVLHDALEGALPAGTQVMVLLVEREHSEDGPVVSCRWEDQVLSLPLLALDAAEADAFNAQLIRAIRQSQTTPSAR